MNFRGIVMKHARLNQGNPVSCARGNEKNFLFALECRFAC
jgi:hypothetical protein